MRRPSSGGEPDMVYVLFRSLRNTVLLTDSLADEDEEIENPDGIQFDVGHDFVRAVMDAPLGSSGVLP
jgi:hypothetical protein